MPMTELTIREQTILYDREATVTAYRKLGRGYADQCGCADCMHFARQRTALYPSAFIALLTQLGIDPHKEEEVFSYGPGSGGWDRELYGGSFYFIGKLVTGNPPGNWQVGPTEFYSHFTESHPSSSGFQASPFWPFSSTFTFRWQRKNKSEFEPCCTVGMNIDQRLEALTCAVEVLVQRQNSHDDNLATVVEMQRKNEEIQAQHDAKLDRRFDLQGKNEVALAQLMESVNSLARIAHAHEQRLTNLEGVS